MKVEKILLDHLPKYAAFLLKNHLTDFVTELIRLSREEDVPLLKYFSSMSDEKLFELGLISNEKMLTLLSQNKATEFIEESTKEFITNQLPIISREDILIEDITLVSLVRRKAFRNLLTRFTHDTAIFANIMEDVEIFVTATENASFNAYNKIQQAHINKINEELKLRQQQLLEAQDIAGMGSFFWDMTGNNSDYTPGALKIFGLTNSTNLNSFLEDVHPDDREKRKSEISESLATLKANDYYLRVVNPDGKVKMLKGRGEIITDNQNRPVLYNGTCQDVTTEYLLNKDLQEKVLKLFDESLDKLGFLVLGSKENILAVEYL